MKTTCAFALVALSLIFSACAVEPGLESGAESEGLPAAVEVSRDELIACTAFNGSGTAGAQDSTLSIISLTTQASSSVITASVRNDVTGVVNTQLVSLGSGITLTGGWNAGGAAADIASVSFSPTAISITGYQRGTGAQINGTITIAGANFEYGSMAGMSRVTKLQAQNGLLIFTGVPSAAPGAYQSANFFMWRECGVTASVTGNAGTIALGAVAAGSTRVDFIIDGVGVGALTTMPYTLNYNSLQLADGTHTLVVRAIDELANIARSAPLSFTIANAATYPTVSASAVISGTGPYFNFAATAAHSTGITKVEFRIDGQLQFTDSVAPYALSYDSRFLVDGAHTLVARAYNPAGLFTDSAAIGFTTTNGASACGGFSGSGTAGNQDTNLTITSIATTAGTSTLTMRVRNNTTGNVVTQTISLGNGVTLSGGWNVGGPNADIRSVSISTTGIVVQGVVQGTTTPVNGTIAIAGGAYFEPNGFINVSRVTKMQALGGSLIFTAVPTVSPTSFQSSVVTMYRQCLVGAAVTGTNGLIVLKGMAGNATRVDFIVDGLYVGQSLLGSPYMFGYNSGSLANGNHTLIARAIDPQGNVRRSGAYTFPIANGVNLPAVTVSATGTNGTVVFGATASDPSGIQRVEFRINGYLAGTVTTAPYNFNFNSTTWGNGSYALTARAYNGAGYPKDSAELIFTLTNGVAASVVAAPMVLGTTGVITLSTTVTAAMNKVEFVIDGVVRGTVTTPPYSLMLDSNVLTPGNHWLVARATSTTGVVTNSTGTTFWIMPDVFQPVVSTVTVTPGASPNLFTFSASATDDRMVARVEYYMGGTDVSQLVGTSYAPPYTVSYDAMLHRANGNHTLYAVAVDTSGNRGQKTAPVAINIPTYAETGTANDTLATAQVVTPAMRIAGFMSPATDVDYYRIRVGTGQTLGLQMGTSGGTTVNNTNMYLYTSAGTLIASAAGPTPYESLSVVNTSGGPIDYFLRVDCIGTAGLHQYFIKVNTPFDITNPTASISATAGASSNLFNLNVTANDASGIARVDFYVSIADATGYVGSDTTAPYSILYDAMLRRANGNTSIFAIVTDNFGNIGNANAGLAIAIPTHAEAATANDTLATAQTFSQPNLRIVGTLNQYGDLVDWYKIRVGAGQPLTLTSAALDSFSQNSNLALFNAAGVMVASSSNPGPNESISFTNSGALADFYLRVDAASLTSPHQYFVKVVTPVAGETVPPTVSVAQTAGATPGSFNLTANASDASGIARVDFFVGSTSLPAVASDSVAPYAAAFDAMLLRASGSTTVYAVAYDIYGNSAQATVGISISIATYMEGAAANDTQATAQTYPTTNLRLSGNLSASDVADWYKIRVSAGQPLALTSGSPDALAQNHNLAVFNAAGTMVGSSTGAGSNESLTITNSTGAAADYFLRIDGVGLTAAHSYFVKVVTAPPDTTPPTVTVTATAGATPNLIVLTANPVDSGGIARVDFYVSSPYLPVVGSATSAPYTVTFDAMLQRVNGNTTIYAIATDTSGNTAQALVGFNIQIPTHIEAGTANDTLATAQTFASTNKRITGQLNQYGDSNDWYKVRVGAGQPISLMSNSIETLGMDHSLELYNAAGTLVASSASPVAAETINYTNSGAAADYYVRIVGVNLTTPHSYFIKVVAIP